MGDRGSHMQEKYDSLRLSPDYSKLDCVTYEDLLALPVRDDLFDTLGGSHHLSTADLIPEHWEAALAKAGSYELQKRPFGLGNEPASHQI